MITDGNKAGSDGSFVELKSGVQNVSLIWRPEALSFAILIWHFHKEARAYAGVVVQVADDPDFISNVRTLFNNDANNETGSGIGKDKRYVETSEGKLIDARGVEARYVRSSAMAAIRRRPITISRWKCSEARAVKETTYGNAK